MLLGSDILLKFCIFLVINFQKIKFVCNVSFLGIQPPAMFNFCFSFGRVYYAVREIKIFATLGL